MLLTKITMSSWTHKSFKELLPLVNFIFRSKQLHKWLGEEQLQHSFVIGNPLFEPLSNSQNFWQHFCGWDPCNFWRTSQVAFIPKFSTMATLYLIFNPQVLKGTFSCADHHLLGVISFVCLKRQNSGWGCIMRTWQVMQKVDTKWFL